MSASLQRAKPQMVAPRMFLEISLTPAKSPGEAIGKPASMISTPKSTSGPGNLHLFLQIHTRAGRLLAVAQVVSKILTVRISVVTVKHLSVVEESEDRIIVNECPLPGDLLPAPLGQQAGSPFGKESLSVPLPRANRQPLAGPGNNKAIPDGPTAAS